MQECLNITITGSTMKAPCRRDSSSSGGGIYHTHVYGFLFMLKVIIYLSQ